MPLHNSATLTESELEDKLEHELNAIREAENAGARCNQ